MATEVVVLEWNTRYLSLVPAILLARARGVRVALWGHGYSKRERPWRRVLRLFVGNLAHALIVYDNETAASLRSSVSTSVYCALNAIDQAPIDAARAHWLDRPEDLAAFRKANHLNGPCLLFISRLETQNRVDWLLEATSILKPAFPKLRLVIIGDGPAASELSALASSLDLEGSVIWVGACYDEMALAPWFLTSDLLVYPANAGLSILHGFGYGLPVVTSNRSEVQAPEVRAIKDQYNGAFYRHGDPKDLARQIARLLSDGDSLDRMSRAARTTIVDRYSVDQMVRGFVRAIEQLRSLDQ